MLAQKHTPAPLKRGTAQATAQKSSL